MGGRGYVDAEYLRGVAQATSSLKARTWELLGAVPGAVLLDAGCGPGEDTLALARLVGPRGRVVGVDSDRSLLRVARRRAREQGLSNVEHRFAALPHLPFRSGTFDGARSERVFQHLKQPRESLEALVRVTRAGGRIVIMEPDWGSLVFDAGDARLEREMVVVGAEHALNNGYAGRRLLGDFRRVGLLDLKFQVIPITYQSLEAADRYILPGFEAAARRRLGARALARWRGSLEQAESEARFFATFNYVLVVGTVPATSRLTP